MSGEFYLRFFRGQRTGQRRGVDDALEFELVPGGMLRYVNSTSYGGESAIRKEVKLNGIVVHELQRIVRDSGLLQQDDAQWPAPGRDGRLELECVCDEVHISLTSAIVDSVEVLQSKDPGGLEVFVNCGHDVKTLVLSLLTVHTRVRPL